MKNFNTILESEVSIVRQHSQLSALVGFQVVIWSSEVFKKGYLLLHSECNTQTLSRLGKGFASHVVFQDVGNV